MYIYIALQVYKVTKAPNLGKAFLLNNHAGEYPGSRKNIDALEELYKKLGFKVKKYENCDDAVSISFTTIYLGKGYLIFCYSSSASSLSRGVTRTVLVHPYEKITKMVCYTM